ncbi:MAG: FadR family transcriptional regulator [Geminicoccaceae bacterium]|nr:FadR family transcriptional regulator [Geminicoccaceae bacterium]
MHLGLVEQEAQGRLAHAEEAGERLDHGADADVPEQPQPVLGTQRRSVRLAASGLLAPGDVLPPERDLAAMLEVSRESLRGALQILAERGVLEIGHGSRTRVRAMPAVTVLVPHETVERLDDASVLEARRVLEADLCARAAALVDDGDIARLERLVEAQGQMLDDPVRFQISDQTFHLFIFEAARSPVLATFARQAYAHAYARRREVIEHPDGIPTGVRHHRAIVEALATGEPERASAAMRAHIDAIFGLLANLPAAGVPGSESGSRTVFATTDRE